MAEAGFNEIVSFRLNEEELSRIDNLVYKKHTDDGDKQFDNLSHFLRCAMLNFMRKLEKN